jgi:dihydroflavonol-4-reductase
MSGPVLVTGAGGFLGGWVARALLAAGHPLRLLVRGGDRDRARPALFGSGAGLPPGSAGKVEVVAGDILDPTSVARAAAGAAAVVHIAGLVSLRPRDTAELYRINVEGTRNVLGSACAQGVRALHTSSIATVGTSETPVVRDERDRLDLCDAAGYAYAASKHQGEAVALELARAGGDVVVLNPGLMLGPGDVRFTSTRIVRDHLNGTLRFSLPGGSSFADVRDVAAAYPAALARAAAGQRYILAGVNISYADLLRELSRLTGRPGAWPLMPLAARWFGLMSQLASAVVPHPFEELNSMAVAYGSRFNYCRANLAARTLGFRTRPFEQTLRDTISDHLDRLAGGAGHFTPIDSPMPGSSSVQ